MTTPIEKEKMTDAELDAELRANGIDPHELNQKMLAKLLKARREGHDTPALHEAIRQFEEAVNPTQPTFAHSLAGYLTRNGQEGNWLQMESWIRRFMEDSKLEVTRQ